MHMVESKVTPRFLGGSIGLGSNDSPPTFKTMPWELLTCSCDVMTRSSVLSSLSFNIFMAIQALISLTQASILDLASSFEIDSEGLKAIYSCVSSAYKWNVSLCFRQISPRGVVYKVKSIGPNTDP